MRSLGAKMKSTRSQKQREGFKIKSRCALGVTRSFSNERIVLLHKDDRIDGDEAAVSKLCEGP